MNNRGHMFLLFTRRAESGSEWLLCRNHLLLVNNQDHTSEEHGDHVEDPRTNGFRNVCINKSVSDQSTSVDLNWTYRRTDGQLDGRNAFI